MRPPSPWYQNQIKIPQKKKITFYDLKKKNSSPESGHAAKSLQSCLALCDPIDSSPARLPRPWDSPGKNTGVGCHFLLQCMKVKRESEAAQLCPTLPDPMDCTLLGSSIHRILQARVLEWVAIAFSLLPRALGNYPNYPILRLVSILTPPCSFLPWNPCESSAPCSLLTNLGASPCGPVWCTPPLGNKLSSLWLSSPDLLTSSCE